MRKQEKRTREKHPPVLKLYREIEGDLEEEKILHLIFVYNFLKEEELT